MSEILPIIEYVIHTELFWIIVGALLGTLLGLQQKQFMNNLSNHDVHQVLSLTFMFSALRIILACIILLVAFYFSPQFGLSCLITFLVTRWIWLFLLARNRSG